MLRTAEENKTQDNATHCKVKMQITDTSSPKFDQTNKELNSWNFKIQNILEYGWLHKWPLYFILNLLWYMNDAQNYNYTRIGIYSVFISDYFRF